MTSTPNDSSTPDSRPGRTGLRWRVPDDWAYLLPMAAFLVGTAAVGQSSPWYPVGYAAKAVVTLALLIWLWPRFTRISWSYWWLGAILGVVGIFQWVGMQLWLQGTFAGMQPATLFFQPPPANELYNPFERIQPGWLAWVFVAVRIATPTLIVPVMEELFWRDYLWRRIIAPNDFRLATIGEWDWKAYVVVSLAFAVVHGHWWLTSIVWGFMIGGLLLYTRSLGACIVMHGVTNLLLAGYVLGWRDWAFW